MLANDISSGSFGFAKVRTTFAGAHGILTSTAYNRATYLDAKRKHQIFSLRKEFHPEDVSILSSVMGVTQEVRYVFSLGCSLTHLVSE